jgi:hypothetical protein
MPRLLIPLVVLLTCSACEEHELTRPAGGNTAYRWTLIWIAGALLTAVITWMAVSRLRKHSGWRRLVGGGFWFLTAAGLLLFLGSQIALDHRGSQLQDRFGGCREVPVAQRAPSLVPITCQEDDIEIDFDFGAALFVTAIVMAVYVVPTVVPVVIGTLALRTRRERLWIPAVLAVLPAIFLSSRLGHESGAGLVAAVLFVIGAIVSATFLMTEWYDRADWSRPGPR